MTDANTLDLSNAPTFRKKATVVAFHQSTGATYDKMDSWGSNQKLPGPHYMIVGTVRRGTQFAGNRLLKGDVYGCGEDEFHSMYEPTGQENEYRKTETVHALQMDEPFTVDTTTGDGNIEVEGARGNAGDWVVLQPGGERQLIRATQFAELYEPVDDRR